jgi:hypothetical protein
MNIQRITTDTNPMTENYYSNGTVMLLQEAMARARMRESQRLAAEWRLARRLTSAKRWGRLSRWAARHAAEANRAL